MCICASGTRFVGEVMLATPISDRWNFPSQGARIHERDAAGGVSVVKLPSPADGLTVFLPFDKRPKALVPWEAGSNLRCLKCAAAVAAEMLPSIFTRFLYHPQ